MNGRNLFSGLMVFAIALLWPSAGVAEVGYINILNGVDPAQAFVVERQGKAITPKGIYTDLEDGDVVKPSAEALLLFTPTDTACEAVELQGEFTVTPCPPPAGGLKDAAYDFVANKFMSAPEDSVGVFATRGARDVRVHSLPPQALRLYVESADLAGRLKKTPFIALTGNKADAEALIVGQGPVQLLSRGESGGERFQLPAEETALRQALLRRIHYKTVADLASPGPWPAVEWTINVHAPAADGAVDYDGQKWSVVKKVTAADGKPAPIEVREPCLLTFQIANRGDKPYYAYLVNYTGEGQVLPFLPPQDEPQRPNLVAAKADLPLAGFYLELGQGQEFVRLIISENPLDVRHFEQASLTEPAETATGAGRLRPAPEGSWFTVMQGFEVK